MLLFWDGKFKAERELLYGNIWHDPQNAPDPLKIRQFRRVRLAAVANLFLAILAVEVAQEA